MGRQKSANRERAFEIFVESGGKATSAEIAEQLGEKINNINSWRSKDKWRQKVGKVGAPFGNQNGLGNNGGAPKGNHNHYIHGLYSKYLPKKTYDIMRDIEGMNPLDMLWANIEIKFAAILRSQEIMFVKDQADLTKELKKTKSQKEIKKHGHPQDGVGEGEYEAIEVYREEEYELQFAWDKQATFLNAQSKAMGQLTNMIRRYDEMLHKNWDMATEEQKTRIERMKMQIQNPTLKHQRAKDKTRLDLERERFEYQKKQDELKNF